MEWPTLFFASDVGKIDRRRKECEMKLILLVSLKKHANDWSLYQEIQGAIQNNKLSPLQTEGVIHAGRDALLFDESIAHNTLVRVCAYLIEKTDHWPYFVVPVEATSILVEGTCPEALQTILDKSKVQDDKSSPRAP